MYRIFLISIALLMPWWTPAWGISLSPANWTQEEYDRLERMSLNRYERPKPLAVSEGRGIVAGTTEPFAVHSGMDALRKGGNAMDACLATALAGIINASWKSWWTWWGILGEEPSGEELNSALTWLRFDGKNHFIGMNNLFHSIAGFFHLVQNCGSW